MSKSIATLGEMLVEDAVVTQIEFYLSDSNLPFDKYLFTVWSESFNSPSPVILATPIPSSSSSAKPSKQDESSHDAFHLGWIPLSRLTSFKRMQPYLSAPPNGLGSIDKVAEVLSEKSKLVEVRQFGAGEDKAWYLRRTMELSRPEDVMARSAYAKGFPVETTTDDSEEAKQQLKDKELELQKNLEKWAKSLDVGHVKSVRMRREDKPPPADKPKAGPLKNRGAFKGSIFIEFGSKDSVSKLLSLDPKPTYEGKELEIMSKADYVEMKRKIYAPDAKPDPELPRSPYPGKGRNAKPFNAWVDHLIGPHGVPKPVPAPGERSSDNNKGAGANKKRKAEGESEDREVLYDGVRFTARKTGDEVVVVDRETVGLGEGGWPTGRVLRLTLAPGTEEFQPVEFKKLLEPIAKPAFVYLFGDRPRAPLPEVKVEPQDKMVTDVQSSSAVKPTAPPVVVAASDLRKVKKENEDEKSRRLEGQASFKEDITDEKLEQLNKEVGDYKGRQVKWVRATPEQEREHILSRAQFHAEQAFNPERGGGGQRGRGGHNRGRGRGRGGSRGGGDRFKKSRTS